MFHITAATLLLAVITFFTRLQEERPSKPAIPEVVLHRKDAARRLRVIGKSENNALAEGNRPHLVEFEFMRYGEFRVIRLKTISRQEAEGKPVVSVYGVNSRYGFWLTDNGKGPLVVRNIATDDKARAIVDGFLFGSHLFDNPIRVGGFLLADFLSFPLVQWRADTGQAGAWRFIGKGKVPSPFSPDHFHVESFDITVDGRGWIVHQTMSMGLEHKVDVTVTYEGERPLSETSVGIGRGMKYLDQLTTYDTWDDQASPQEADYSLSAFGLPEPFGIEWEKPTPWWLYIGGGTLGLLAVAAIGYRLLSRRAA